MPLATANRHTGALPILDQGRLGAGAGATRVSGEAGKRILQGRWQFLDRNLVAKGCH